MNNLAQKFGKQIKEFWNSSLEERNEIVEKLREYSNLNSDRFEKEFKEIMFDKNIDPLPIMLEVLSKNTDRWGQLYVDVLKDIFLKAKRAKDPKLFLDYIGEYAYIEGDTKPFVQKIVDYLFQHLDSDNLYIKLAAIWTLTYYMDNPSVRNKAIILTALQNKLVDKNWQVRYAAFKSLGYENLLPEGQKLLLKDKILKFIFGEPYKV